MVNHVNAVVAGVFLTFFVAETTIFAVHYFILFFFLAAFSTSIAKNVFGLDPEIDRVRSITYPFALIVYSYVVAQHNYNIYLQDALGRDGVIGVNLIKEQFEKAQDIAVYNTMLGFTGYYALLICLTIYF